jgi:serine/threonine protein kinase
MHITEPPAVPSSLNPDIPPDVDSIILKCLAKEPLKRFQTAVELRRAVAQVSHRLGRVVLRDARELIRANRNSSDLSKRHRRSATLLDQVVSTLADNAPTQKERPAVRRLEYPIPRDSDPVARGRGRA